MALSHIPSTWSQFHQHVYEKLLRLQIPKAPKIQSNRQSFIRFKKAVCKMLAKSTPEIFLYPLLPFLYCFFATPGPRGSNHRTRLIGSNICPNYSMKLFLQVFFKTKQVKTDMKVSLNYFIFEILIITFTIT